MRILILALLLFIGGCDGIYEKPKNKGHVTVENHDYLILTIDGNYGQSIIHNPECLIKDIKLDNKGNER